MHVSKRLLRPLVLACLALVLAAPAAAQDGAQAPNEFPTVDALQNSVIPPRDRVALAEELLGVTYIEPPPSTPPEYHIGDHETFRVANTSENLSFEVDAVLRAVGRHIYLWVEAGTNVSNDDLKHLARAFDDHIYDDVRGLWGSEASPGIDGDPHIYGLFVHDLGAGTAAYFVSEHTFPREAVSTSNEHEMFFFNLDSLGEDFDVQEVESVVSHEFQHMIRNNLQLNEEYWINEGYSEFTQLHFYDVPVWEILSFLSNPETQLNTWAEETDLRARNYGAALLFVTYFYDRYGLDALNALSADPSNRALDSVDNVLRSMGEPDVNEFFADWVVANMLFDPRIDDGRYGYQSIAPGIVSAAPRDTISQYPVDIQDAVNQYATNYWVLTNLDDVDTLTVNLEAPATVNLVPTSAPSGQRMWYSNKADVSSTTLTRTFDLSNVDSATLNYKLWYYAEDLWDFGYVMASGDGGVTWDILTTGYTTEENPYNTAYGPGYTGESGGWLDESVSLDAYAGKQVMVRFQMITDDAVTQPGMLIDDVSIPEIDYTDDFESDNGGWQAEGWVLIDNILPQQVWVQAIQQIGDDAVVTRWLGPQDDSWTLPLEDGVDQVTLAISPFAPVSTVPMDYALQVTGE
jgi:immune inhibitor A